jgi:hypothetical protein
MAGGKIYANIQSSVLPTFTKAANVNTGKPMRTNESVVLLLYAIWFFIARCIHLQE